MCFDWLLSVNTINYADISYHLHHVGQHVTGPFSWIYHVVHVQVVQYSPPLDDQLAKHLVIKPPLSHGNSLSILS